MNTHPGFGDIITFVVRWFFKFFKISKQIYDWECVYVAVIRIPDERHIKCVKSRDIDTCLRDKINKDGWWFRDNLFSYCVMQLVHNSRCELYWYHLAPLRALLSLSIILRRWPESESYRDGALRLTALAVKVPNSNNSSPKEHNMKWRRGGLKDEEASSDTTLSITMSSKKRSNFHRHWTIIMVVRRLSTV